MEQQNDFKPYISPKDFIPEFTLKAIILGSIFGIIFGAATVYLGLKVGLTVSASIPIAVLAISIFKKVGKATILESNMVQTIGSAGESVAAGVVFTVPALLFLAEGKAYFQYFQIFVLSLAGGILGVLFMVPLRKSLIVKEHGNLPYPEGTACANVLIAGEKGGSLANMVYYGLGLAFLYKVLMSVLGLWKEVPSYIFGRKSALPNLSVSGEITPELLGVGYVIGYRIAAVMVAGGILSYWVLIPLITFLGDYVTVAIAPATKPISELDLNGIRANYVRYIGAGAVTFGGLMTLLKTLPTILAAFSDTAKEFSQKKQANETSTERTERSLPMSFVLFGCLFLVIFMVAMPNLPVNALSGVMIIIFGFFFVTVASRIVGLIGSSSSPVSGMTIATLMATCLIFVGMGWTGNAYQPIALVVGSIVCIAAANAGATSQDLKTGFLVGATPYYQQLGLLIGVFVSTLAIGGTMLLLHQSIGIGLVLIGMAIAAVVELCGVSSLAFAVGAYLPLSSTTPIFIGGIVKSMVERRQGAHEAENEAGAGALFSSGLIAGGAITGILIAILMGISTTVNGKIVPLATKFNTGIGESMRYGDLFALVCFLAMAFVLYRVSFIKEKQA
ncbi:MAG: oligopeptide transporter, OPT family [Bacteroidetes bacterium]|nr:MAG: oligopeptide transporter, OPT family [Bacteroidota bacterium]